MDMKVPWIKEEGLFTLARICVTGSILAPTSERPEHYFQNYPFVIVNRSRPAQVAYFSCKISSMNHAGKRAG